MDISIDRHKSVKFLVIMALFLIVIHIIILVTYYYINDPEKFDFVQMFDLDMEANIPTLFSSLLFAISAFCFYLLSLSAIERQQNKHRYWFGLSLVFIFLSFDESAKIHETIGDFTEQFLDATGYLYYPWIIVYSILVFMLGIIYFKFFWQMPRKTFWMFLASAFIYILGAVVFDSLGGKEAYAHGTESVMYSILYTIEESLEMFGVILLISILLKLLEKQKIEIQ